MIAQLYVATTALSSHELDSAELERLRDQGSGLQWCVLQQQVLAPGSMDETSTNPSLPPSSPSKQPVPELPQQPQRMEDTNSSRDHMMTDTPPRHQGKVSPYSSPRPEATTTTTTTDNNAFFLKFRPLIEQLLAKAKTSVANYRWKPKRDPGDVAKLNNLTRGKVDQLVGLAEFIVGIWNADSPPFQIKPALSFSPRGHIYCVACKFTYVHLHKDYVKFIEHFTCVSHLARCRDMDTEDSNEELNVRRGSDSSVGSNNSNSRGGGGGGVNGLGGGGGGGVLSDSPQQSLLHQFAQFVTQTSPLDHS